jgi:hypothetical protein
MDNLTHARQELEVQRTIGELAESHEEVWARLREVGEGAEVVLAELCAFLEGLGVTEESVARSVVVEGKFWDLH